MIGPAASKILTQTKANSRLKLNKGNFIPRLLRFGLLACVAYFVCMAISYFFGIKVPILFVYYYTSFYAFQDKIISLAVLSYVGLFYAASRDIKVVPIALTVLGFTALGLASVNMSDALASVLTEVQSTWPYWTQTGIIAGLWAILTVLYLRQSDA